MNVSLSFVRYIAFFNLNGAFSICVIFSASLLMLHIIISATQLTFSKVRCASSFANKNVEK